VKLWSTDGIKVDLTGAKNKAKVEFMGPFAEFTAGKALSFSVLAVLSDARNKVAPRLETIKVAQLTEKKLQGGTLELTLDGTFDTLTILVSAQAPTDLPDKAYAKAKPIPYAVSVSDAGQTVVADAAPVARSIGTLIDVYRTAAVALHEENPEASAQALTTLDGTGHEITQAIRKDMEAGSTATIDELIAAGADETSRTALRPLARKVAGQLKANALQERGSAPMDERIQLLEGF